MHKRLWSRVSLLIFFFVSLCLDSRGVDNNLRWNWENANAEVDGKGDLRWKPRPFVFSRGQKVRYVDFEGGDDATSGESSKTPWKHHPWDPKATGNSAAGGDADTYVFKRGSVYRGRLIVKRAGQQDHPIRLTSDPQWGRGEAILAGSELVKNWTKGTTHKDIPEPEKIWWADLDFQPGAIWTVGKDGAITRIPLARTPNWKVSNPDDVKSEWWVWDNPGKPFGNIVTNVQGTTISLGIDTQHIKDKSEDYFKDALIWSEYGWVMSGPYPTRVEVVDLERHGLGFAGWTGGGVNGVIMRNMRYYLEDKRQYLDDPNGEFWFEKKGNGGRLYLRLPGDADPNLAQIEAGKEMNLIDGQDVEHVEISGLTFRFTVPAADITAAPWDYSTIPFGLRADMHPGCVRVWGAGRDVRIANCRFEHVFFPIRVRSLVAGQFVDGVRIEDNDFRFTDEGILSVSDGSGWGSAQLRGRLGDVKILRNHSLETGRRPKRFGTGTGIEVSGARTAEIAGNIIERSYAQGIDVHGSKVDGMWGDVPFTRILIHHNKVWESMLNCNDYGGIETWQGGPFYVFDNTSYNALGYRNWERYSGTDAGFGHAYYLDGAFKNYHFNNIAWGKAKDIASPVVNCSAFQEIISYQNTFFNNTVFNFYTGSRRQAPVAGRNKYLGNIWDGIGGMVFRHADPARTAAEGNAKDAVPAREHFDLRSNAYRGNVLFDFAQAGVLEPSGRWLLSFDDFKGALEKHKSITSELGVVASNAPMRDPAHGDFRLTKSSAARDRGAKVFVPWALSGVVGEWNFYHVGGDPSGLIDEHWYMTDYHVSRDTYYQRPTYPLKGVNIEAADYVEGRLEDWISGALKFSARKKQYAFLSNAEMMKPFSFTDIKKTRHAGGVKPEPSTIEGQDLKNPQIYTSNLLIEAFFKTAPGHVGGVIMEKMNVHGYSLAINSAGGISFSLKAPNAAAAVNSKTLVNTGEWHHVIAEADRKTKVLTIYVDGQKDSASAGLDENASLVNDGDLYVGGTPKGRSFDGAFDFLRIAQGTLADADTTIEELYAWEFKGPFLRDFADHKPADARRDAGALELR
jgi:hypothetical protein